MGESGPERAEDEGRHDWFVIPGLAGLLHVHHAVAVRVADDRVERNDPQVGCCCELLRK